MCIYHGEFQSSVKRDWYTLNFNKISSWPILLQLSSLCSHIIIILHSIRLVSLVVASRSYSLSDAVRASYRVGFSRCRAGALGCAGSVAVARGLVFAAPWL